MSCGQWHRQQPTDVLCVLATRSDDEKIYAPACPDALVSYVSNKKKEKTVGGKKGKGRKDRTNEIQRDQTAPYDKR